MKVLSKVRGLLTPNNLDMIGNRDFKRTMIGSLLGSGIVCRRNLGEIKILSKFIVHNL